MCADRGMGREAKAITKRRKGGPEKAHSYHYLNPKGVFHGQKYHDK